MANKLIGFSVNDEAIEIAKRLVIPRQEELQIHCFRQSNGCHIIDMGVNARGGWKAGKFYVEMALGGLGELRYTQKNYAGYSMPAVAVFVDFPDVAEMSCHVSSCRFSYQDREITFSGPIRAKRPDRFSKFVPYYDNTQQVLASYQIDSMPTEDLTDTLAREAGISPENLYLLVASTGSLVGTIQVCARNVEQAYPTLFVNKFDLQAIKYACGITPVVSVVQDEMEAYGRVNDCLIYGQETLLYVDCEDEQIISILPLITMDQERNQDVYAIPFRQIFARCNNDWCQVPRHWDAPNKINFYNLRTNHYFTAGTQCDAVLMGGFWGERGAII